MQCPRDPATGVLLTALFLVLCLAWLGLSIRVLVGSPHLAQVALVAGLIVPFSVVNVATLLWRGQRFWQHRVLDVVNVVIVLCGGLALRLPLDPESSAMLIAAVAIAGAATVLRLLCD
jgi:hypothetical protein